MGAIDAITSHAIIREPGPKTHTSEFLDDMAQEPAPSISYRSSVAPSAGCERNVAEFYNKFSEYEVAFELSATLIGKHDILYFF